MAWKVIPPTFLDYVSAPFEFEQINLAVYLIWS